MIDALPLLLGPEGYQISRSVRLRSSASAYFNRTPASAGNRRTFTWSGWVKLGTLGTEVHLLNAGTGNAADFRIYIAGSKLSALSYNGTSYTTYVESAAVLRDPSSWYHIVAAIDTTQATSTNRVKLYINGVQVTAFSQTTYMSQNFDTQVNNTVSHAIGRYAWSASNYFDGYLTEVNFIDGQALTPSSFGETDAVTGVWKPKKYTGTYGTNGFYLNFSDNSAATATTIGKDYSGNGNNWTPNNISVTAGATYDSMLDVPTLWADGGNGRGNYATLNPLQKVSGYAPDNGNLRSVMNATGNIFATIGVTTGKWYWENIYEVAPNGEMQYGVALASVSTSSQPGNVSGSWSYSPFTGAVYSQSGTPIANVATAALNDVIGLALDVDAGTLAIYKNNSLLYTITSISGGTLFPVIGGSASINARTSVTFGQRPFTYTPPTGFKALNTLNLPEPTILKGNQYFDAVTYAGSASQQTITTSLVGLDFAWIKNRTAARSHVLVDRVRGGSPLLTLYSNLTAAEDNTSTNFNPTSFTDSGIVLGGAKLGINNASENFVLWGWKEGATQGFDIVTYTGDGVANRTVAHNLGVTPAMILVKARNSSTYAWNSWHKGLTAGYYIGLNATSPQDNSVSIFPSGGVTSTNWNTGGNAIYNNGNGVNYVAYVFAEVAGFSAFGKYTGNGSADGPMIFTGFLPRWLMWKRSDSTGSWFIYDSARGTTNVMGPELYAESSAAEATATRIDFLSNGFKLRAANAGDNANGATYVYACFASNPFKNSLAR